MQLLISDSNVLIDLIVINQIDNMFKLPYSFIVPDILYDQELKNDHSNLLTKGLKIKKLSSETIMYSMELMEKYSKPGRNDLFALALAKQESSPLITGDQDLRDAAQKEAVVLYGTIWVIEELIAHNIITIDNAKGFYLEMKEKKRRLPWKIANAHLEEIEKNILEKGIH
ncbi:PIN domain-containing protein [Aliarcobacter butzleri]|uniref:PIN domain-containing protein n=1 Tax=Aliarcobacter butzleri TaxID=28197 RepID=UPI00125ED332|nr:PIN domain-containing protein [Aliarcobacter butzleri]MCT7630955.1 PIN domain-containing protein [Aliarcobacter butzleri]